MATDPFFFDVPKCSVAQLVNSDSTNKKTLVTAATNGTKVISILAASDDSADRYVSLWVTRSAASYLLGTIKIAATSGSVYNLPSVNLFDAGLIPGLPYDNDGNPFMFLNSGDTLQLSVSVAVTAAKTLHFVAIHSDDT